jgi:pimeloyl-ACP methyl ester carboxylesterase
MDVLERNNIHVSGRGERAMVFAHGFGCDQNMWRFVAPEFENDFKVVLFDQVGAGGSICRPTTRRNIPHSMATPTIWWKSAAR